MTRDHGNDFRLKLNALEGFLDGDFKLFPSSQYDSYTDDVSYFLLHIDVLIRTDLRI